jgi:hypothetical protein
MFVYQRLIVDNSGKIFRIIIWKWLIWGCNEGSSRLLVGGFNPSEKYESQIGSSSQLLGKIKSMFQTTNQISS